MFLFWFVVYQSYISLFHVHWITFSYKYSVSQFQYILSLQRAGILSFYFPLSIGLYSCMSQGRLNSPVLGETFRVLDFLLKSSLLFMKCLGLFILFHGYSNGFSKELKNGKNHFENTPGTRGGPGGRDRTLAVKRRKTP